MGEQHISDLVTGKERDLIVRGLQALWRERITAYNLACHLEQNRGKVINLEDFGVPEIADELRVWGAAPHKY